MNKRISFWNTDLLLPKPPFLSWFARGDDGLHFHWNRETIKIKGVTLKRTHIAPGMKLHIFLRILRELLFSKGGKEEVYTIPLLRCNPPFFWRSRTWGQLEYMVVYVFSIFFYVDMDMRDICRQLCISSWFDSRRSRRSWLCFSCSRCRFAAPNRVGSPFAVLKRWLKDERRILFESNFDWVDSVWPPT